MYSPKIREDLIPRIYRVAKNDSVPMTVWVNQTMESALALREQQTETPKERKENDSHETK